jgi:hypothetical protein
MPNSNEPTPDLHDEQHVQEEQGLRTRAAHLQWAKDRALAYCDQGDVLDAFASMVSDLRQHPDTADHAGIALGMRLLLAGQVTTQRAMQRFIEGFN